MTRHSGSLEPHFHLDTGMDLLHHVPASGVLLFNLHQYLVGLLVFS